MSTPVLSILESSPLPSPPGTETAFRLTNISCIVGISRHSKLATITVKAVHVQTTAIFTLEFLC